MIDYRPIRSRPYLLREVALTVIVLAASPLVGMATVLIARAL